MRQKLKLVMTFTSSHILRLNTLNPIPLTEMILDFSTLGVPKHEKVQRSPVHFYMADAIQFSRV